MVGNELSSCGRAGSGSTGLSALEPEDSIAAEILMSISEGSYSSGTLEVPRRRQTFASNLDSSLP